MAVNVKPVLPGGDRAYDSDPGLALVQGAYASYPAATPKYYSPNGRDRTRNLTVARLYLSGGDYANLPGAASNFEIASYVGFFLQEVTERNTEKSQIIPMNGDGYAAFFSGKEPSVYSFSGVLLNTQQDQWRSTLANLYEEVFRGSKVAGMNRMVQIAYDDKVVTGSMMNLTQVLASNPEETYARFTFDILVAATYDSWMNNPAQFYNAGNAFLGDKSIFPDVSRKTDKKNLDNFVRSAYLAPPPARSKTGTAVACNLEKITVALSGATVASELSKVTAASKCLNDKALANMKEAIDREDALASTTTGEAKAKHEALAKKYRDSAGLLAKAIDQRLDAVDEAHSAGTYTSPIDQSENRAAQAAAEELDRDSTSSSVDQTYTSIKGA